MFEPFCSRAFLSLCIVLLGCLHAGAQPVAQKEEAGLSGMPLQDAKAFQPVSREALRLEDSSSRYRKESSGSRRSGIDEAGGGDSARMRRLPLLPEPAKNRARSLPDRTERKRDVAWGVSTALTGIAATTFGLCYWKDRRRFDPQLQDKGIDPLALGIVATLAIPVGVVMTCLGISAAF